MENTKYEQGFWWFLRSTETPKRKKKIFVWSLFFFAMLVLLIFVALGRGSNTLVSLQFTTTLYWPIVLITIVGGCYGGYLTSWIYKRWTRILSLVFAGVIGLFLFLSIAGGVPMTLDLLLPIKKYQTTRTVEISKPDVSTRGCRNGIKVKATFPNAARYCNVPFQIRTFAKEGDTLIVKGKENFLVFEIDSYGLKHK